MKPFKERVLFACLAMIMPGMGAEAANEGLLSNQIVVAVRHRDCPPAVIQFNPVSGEMRLVAAPKAERAEPVTGRYVGEPLVDTHNLIEKAWRAAMATVPKATAEQLSNQSVELPLDMDMTLEVARVVIPKENDSNRLLPGDRLRLGNTSTHP